MPSRSGVLGWSCAKEVSGADFWKAGPEGVASQWTGDAGRKRLAVRIQTVIPRPVDEINL